ncbi:hypothetical protein JOB18_043139 [Solea senegalensis]|uniref:Uncharacterized protein n=1 Tax=Solea senegalensis TaxID=28829 RepID=A0AAV6TAV4_SOLSE|nr:hypothetical protein JOB18_043139 [Solea senegalensis]
MLKMRHTGCLRGLRSGSQSCCLRLQQNSNPPNSSWADKRQQRPQETPKRDKCCESFFSRSLSADSSLCTGEPWCLAARRTLVSVMLECVHPKRVESWWWTRRKMSC